VGNIEQFQALIEMLCEAVKKCTPLIITLSSTQLIITLNEMKREMKKCPISRYLSPQGPRWGTWRGFASWDFLKEKDSISGFCSWTQRTLRF
jgi:hypothetical protein